MSVPVPTNSSTHFNYHFYHVITGQIKKRAEIQRTDSVDIIIPVYNAMKLTEACIASVLKNSDNCRLLVVNDASTDPEIKSYLNSLQSIPEKKIEVFVCHNEINSGFIKTVNAAYLMTKSHFVILNSDTEVPPGWLNRLFAPIFASPHSIASVTPFSNSSLKWLGCNFPNTEQENEIFKNMDVSRLDSFFLEYSLDSPIEIFSGVGFCMAFNRAVVDKIGLFDEIFGKGFCEEVDWSLRAGDAGYKNVLVPNLFVFHKFGASFDLNEKQSLQETNFSKLLSRNRNYIERKMAFHTKEATQPIRDSLAIVADVQTKGTDRWLAVLGGEKSSWDVIKQKIVILDDFDEFKGFLFISFNSNEQGLKLHFFTPVQELIINLPSSVCNMLGQILSFLCVDMAVIVESATWPDSFNRLDQVKCVNCQYLLI